MRKIPVVADAGVNTVHLPGTDSARRNWYKIIRIHCQYDRSVHFRYISIISPQQLRRAETRETYLYIPSASGIHTR